MQKFYKYRPWVVVYALVFILFLVWVFCDMTRIHVNNPERAYLVTSIMVIPGILLFCLCHTMSKYFQLDRVSQFFYGIFVTSMVGYEIYWYHNSVYLAFNNIFKDAMYFTLAFVLGYMITQVINWKRVSKRKLITVIVILGIFFAVFSVYIVNEVNIYLRNQKVVQCHQRFDFEAASQELEKFRTCEDASECVVIQGTMCGFQSGTVVNARNVEPAQKIISACEMNFGCHEDTFGIQVAPVCENHHCQFRIISMP